MKEIKSQRYLKKEAIYSKMPIGNPGLPGQLMERDILGGPDDDEISSSGQIEVGNIELFYTYDYDYNENFVNNINIIKARDYRSNKESTDANTLYRLKEMHEDKIREDIEKAEEGNKLERSPDYNPFE